jgi:hypothetical protein
MVGGGGGGEGERSLNANQSLPHGCSPDVKSNRHKEGGSPDTRRRDANTKFQECQLVECRNL